MTRCSRLLCLSSLALSASALFAGSAFAGENCCEGAKSKAEVVAAAASECSKDAKAETVALAEGECSKEAKAQTVAASECSKDAKAETVALAEGECSKEAKAQTVAASECSKDAKAEMVAVAASECSKDAKAETVALAASECSKEAKAQTVAASECSKDAKVEMVALAADECGDECSNEAKAVTVALAEGECSKDAKAQTVAASECSKDAKVEMVALAADECGDECSKEAVVAVIADGDECEGECGEECDTRAKAMAAGHDVECEACDAVAHAFAPVNDECTACGMASTSGAKTVFAGFTVGFCGDECAEDFAAKDKYEKVAYITENAELVNTECPGSGMGVDEEQVTLYNGFAIGFCCGDCKADFKEADHGKRAAILAKYVDVLNTECPFSGESVNEELVLAHRGNLIGVCCSDCEAGFNEKDDEGKSKIVAKIVGASAGGCSDECKASHEEA